MSYAFQPWPGYHHARYVAEQREQQAQAARTYAWARRERAHADLACRRIDSALAGHLGSTVETRAANVTTTPVVDVNTRTRIITVIAVPYGQRAQISFKGQTWSEIFERGAFDGIDADPEKVRANREHNRADAIGKAVRFDTRDPRGLIADIQVARSTRGDDTLALATDKALSASVGFGVKPGGEQLDRFTRTRRITRAWLDHIALVQAPAYDGATILAVK